MFDRHAVILLTLRSAVRVSHSIIARYVPASAAGAGAARSACIAATWRA